MTARDWRDLCWTLLFVMTALWNGYLAFALYLLGSDVGAVVATTGFVASLVMIYIVAAARERDEEEEEE